jgi:hypothetical protein
LGWFVPTIAQLNFGRGFARHEKRELPAELVGKHSLDLFNWNIQNFTTITNNHWLNINICLVFGTIAHEIISRFLFRIMSSTLGQAGFISTELHSQPNFI